MTHPTPKVSRVPEPPSWVRELLPYDDGCLCHSVAATGVHDLDCELGINTLALRFLARVLVERETPWLGNELLRWATDYLEASK